MMFLREHKRAPTRLCDFLPWAAMVAPGLVLNKDGSFLRVARFRGPDLDSATQAEHVSRAGLTDQERHDGAEELLAVIRRYSK